APAAPDEVRARQAAVAELLPCLDLREELALLGNAGPDGMDCAALAAWGAAPGLLGSRLARLVALLLAGSVVLALVAWWQRWLHTGQLVLAVLPAAAFAFFFRHRVRGVLVALRGRRADLALLAGLLARIEGGRFTAPRLRGLQE